MDRRATSPRAPGLPVAAAERLSASGQLRLAGDRAARVIPTAPEHHEAVEGH